MNIINIINMTLYFFFFFFFFRNILIFVIVNILLSSSSYYSDHYYFIIISITINNISIFVKQFKERIPILPSASDLLRRTTLSGNASVNKKKLNILVLILPITLHISYLEKLMHFYEEKKYFTFYLFYYDCPCNSIAFLCLFGHLKLSICNFVHGDTNMHLFFRKNAPRINGYRLLLTHVPLHHF